MRPRYAEQALEAAIECGTTRYVVLGAGMDSFAVRWTDLTRRQKGFAIDRRAKQEGERNHLRHTGLQVPAD